MKIDKFEGEYYFLSNFYNSDVEYNGHTFKNNEAAFQAQKDTSRVEEFINLPPNKAKSLGRRVKLRDDWEDVKLSIMYDIVFNKFNQNEELKHKLLATGGKELIEGNWWNDTYWGKCNGKGLNKLGQILMDVRGNITMLMALNQYDEKLK